MRKSRARLYAVDTSSFSAMHDTYPRKNFPHVWKLMDALMNRGQITSVEEVLLELDSGPDDVRSWSRKYRYAFWPLTLEIQTQAREILQAYPLLVDLRKPNSSADAFLIARAQLARATVVTEEQRSGGSGKKKIPDVCAGRSIRCTNLLGLLRIEKLG